MLSNIGSTLIKVDQQKKEANRMGAVKQWQIERAEEETGLSGLTWSEVKQVLQYLIKEYSRDTVTYRVIDLIEKREGDAWPGMSWSDIRQVVNNLGELYFTELDLGDLYDQARGFSDRYDSLGDKVESRRESEEFEERISRDD